MRAVHLAAVGTALPGEPVTNEELCGRLGLSSEWVETFIGTRTRHFATDLCDGRVRSTLADLCTAAARVALDRARIPADAVDFLVLATATPDALMPTTAAMVADRLGLDGVPAYQIQSGCTGAVQALTLAMALLAGTGAATGLVLGGDVSSKHLDLRQDFRRLPPSQLVNYVLFGDGAGAALLTASPAAVRLTAAQHRLGGLGSPPGQTVEWFGAADRDSGRPAVTEDYKAIETRVPPLACEVAGELAAALGWDPTTLDFLLPPQLSGRMTARLTHRLRHDTGALTSTEISCVADTGNTGNALPFCQLERLLPLMGPGRRALGVAIESSKWIKAGFALESA